MVVFGRLVTSADLGEAVPRGAARRLTALVEELNARARQCARPQEAG